MEVEVTDEWTNRQVGDRRVAPEKRVLPPSGGRGRFEPQTPAESGLLGPVRVISVTR